MLRSQTRSRNYVYYDTSTVSSESLLKTGHSRIFTLRSLRFSSLLIVFFFFSLSTFRLMFPISSEVIWLIGGNVRQFQDNVISLCEMSPVTQYLYNVRYVEPDLHPNAPTARKKKLFFICLWNPGLADKQHCNSTATETYHSTFALPSKSSHRL